MELMIKLYILYLVKLNFSYFTLESKQLEQVAKIELR